MIEITAVMIAILGLASIPLFAKSAMDIRLGHIAISVTDLSESEQFYSETLGLKQIPEPFGEGRHAWFNIGHAELHVIQAAEERTERDKSNHLCFTVSDLDAFKERLTAYEVEYADFAGNVGEVNTRPDGVRQIYFQDPDGYWVEVNDAY